MADGQGGNKASHRRIEFPILAKKLSDPNSDHDFDLGYHRGNKKVSGTSAGSRRRHTMNPSDGAYGSGPRPSQGYEGEKGKWRQKRG